MSGIDEKSRSEERKEGNRGDHCLIISDIHLS